MHRQLINSSQGRQGGFASRSGAVLAMMGLLLLSACGGGGPSVTDNNLAEPGLDGIPPTLTTVTIQPDGFVELGQSIRIDIVATEALMKPVVMINGVEADVTGSIDAWRAIRQMTAADIVGEVAFSIVFEDISGEQGATVTATTNGSTAEYCAEDCPKDELGALEGKWVLDLAGVGPAEGDVTWWNTDMGTTKDDRACWFDDFYEFDADGSFKNVQGDETWLEPWQGVAEGCGAPVAPHDGSANAVFEYDEADGTLKLTGRGAYLGVSKVVNGAELAAPADAPESITYNVSELIDNSLTVTIEVAGGGWWTYELTRISNSPVVGKWKLATEDGAGVGPAAGDIQWWSTNDPGVVVQRACLFDDIYHFGDDGSFQNYHGDETWLETWQGVAADGCGAPVPPHDGGTVGAWIYDATNSKLTLDGRGSYLGIAKAVNGAELSDPAATPDSVTYDVLDLDGDTMKVSVDVAGDGSSWWTVTLQRDTDTVDLRGKWQLNTDSGAGVGPAAGDIQWWSTNDPGVVEQRACLFDDVYDFGRDGSFMNDQGDETWLEIWQGVAADGCGTPIAPHDGSARAIYDYDEDASTLTVYGTGAYLGLSKPVNGAELADPLAAPESITYDVLAFDGDLITVTVDVAGDGSAWWTYNLVRSSASPVVGNWKLDANDSGVGVGPAAGDIQWWSSNDPGVVEQRACLFDDVFHFGGDGSFQNFQDGETWLETWQAAAEECGVPVAPHDGSAAGRYIYNSVDQTLTILGTGSHVGIPKAVNGAELDDPLATPDSVTYDVLDLEGNSMTVTVDVAGDGSSWWTFKLAKEE